VGVAYSLRVFLMFLNSIIVEELLDSSSNTGIVGSEMKKVQCIDKSSEYTLGKIFFYSHSVQLLGSC
jgi:hypothetical protein